MPVNLMPHQREAIDKLLPAQGRLLADSMGLGKTYTAIGLDGYMRSHGAHGPTLIICPKSLLGMWHRTMTQDWNMGEGIIQVIDPKNRAPFETALHAAQKDERDGYFIMHWDALARISWPERRRQGYFLHVIADEAHMAKNRKAQRTVALKKIKTHYKTALTGTPADNAPQDIWSLLNWLYPMRYRSYWRFFDDYLEWNVHPTQGYRIIEGVKNTDALRQELAPFYVRRRLDDVIDMPAKTYTEIPVQLDGSLRKSYDQMDDELMADVAEGDILSPNNAVKFMRLQQFTLSQLKESEPGVYVATPPSPKLDALRELIANNPDEKFVVFSQFTSILYLLAQQLDEDDVGHAGPITGVMESGGRQRAVESFQTDSEVRVISGTFGAMGTGHTLTAARKVVFLDRSPNPSANAQAEDRLWRIGQNNTVQVIDLVAKDTVDGYRKHVIARKAEWIDAIVE